jgi:hypothetical protein
MVYINIIYSVYGVKCYLCQVFERITCRYGGMLYRDLVLCILMFGCVIC